MCSGSFVVVEVVVSSLCSECAFGILCGVLRWIPVDRTLHLQASTDLHVFLIREHQAFALFLETWSKEGRKELVEGGGHAQARTHRAHADDLLQLMEKYLWSPVDRIYVGFNVSSHTSIPNRVWLSFLPLWGKLAPVERLDT